MNKLIPFSALTIKQSSDLALKKKNKIKKPKFKFPLQPVLIATLLSYIGVRHLLPTLDYEVYKEDGTGDKLIGHTHVNCILFDRVSTWWDCGSYTCISNVNKWRRVNLVIK
jgi:hypothetical protein